MNPTRLFDCIDVQLARFPQEAMFAAKEEGGIWRKYSTAEVKELVDRLAAGLLHLGISGNDMSVEKRDKIALISNNRPEWMMLDLAVQKTGAVLVPIYPTLAANELEFVLNDAEVKLVFVSDTELYQKVQSVRDKVPSIKAVFTFDYIQPSLHWKEIMSKAGEEDLKKLAIAASSIRYEDMVTIIYTSGTTGTPKGVMLSHKNILSNVISSTEVFAEFCAPGDRALSFLPLNHIFERMVTYIYLFNGVSVWYAESLEKIGDNLKEVQPSLFTTVPRLLEKVYERIMGRGQELTGLKKKLFFWAVDVGSKFEAGTNQGFLYNTQLAIANKLIFNKWREGLGGKVKAIVTGAAACQVRLLRVFTAGKMNILEGYGLTETSPVIAVNRFSESGRRFGTVGPVIKGVEVKLEEDGEICCKGDNVMMGYYKRPDLTAEVIDKNGYFHTGDIGVMQEGKFLKITDRKKEIFKTSGGKYVAPQPIENKMKESKFIEQMIVVGPERKFAGALIVPSFENLKVWAGQNNISYGTVHDLIRNPAVLEMYKNIVEEFNTQFNHVEQIKKFELCANEWTVDGGELTPTLKLKRKVIMEKYRDAIERIYL
ncbi:AMP-dependent synthetase/ligase [Lacibacter sediminis]|uniref:Long-chain fatty acid--CoA ligase n=1 Tax=Lacibacter sediminis TaxID=2760713 RepID=A0A7G5XHT3_9BACT|nr:long-chain fatty acid--CoA ligase [Lacibacter sediminis]QNA45036.1 long-chain fatty acid--CoA ligase [Lacibacter sediminis]